MRISLAGTAIEDRRRREAFRRARVTHVLRRGAGWRHVVSATALLCLRRVPHSRRDRQVQPKPRLLHHHFRTISNPPERPRDPRTHAVNHQVAPFGERCEQRHQRAQLAKPIKEFIVQRELNLSRHACRYPCVDGHDDFAGRFIGTSTGCHSTLTRALKGRGCHCRKRRNPAFFQAALYVGSNLCNVRDLGSKVVRTVRSGLGACGGELAERPHQFGMLGQGLPFGLVPECESPCGRCQVRRFATFFRACSLVAISFVAAVAFFSQVLSLGDGCTAIGLEVTGMGDSPLPPVDLEFSSESFSDAFMVAFLRELFDMVPPVQFLVVSGVAVVEDGQANGITKAVVDRP